MLAGPFRIERGIALDNQISAESALERKG